jgi:hypothetical protein
MVDTHLSDAPLGSDLFFRFAREYRYEQSFASTLTEAQLGDLYTWLERTFPVRQDARHQSGVASRPRDSFAHLRDGILRQLVNKGSMVSSGH